MRKQFVSLVVVAFMTSTVVALGSDRAQDMPEPTEGDDKPAAAPVGDEPEEPMLPGEKPGDADKPADPDADELPAVLIEEPNKTYYGIGVRARAVTTPAFMLDLFFDHHTGAINSAGFGLEFVRRKRNLDIVVTSVLQTTAGRMIFGRHLDGPAAAVDRDDTVKRPRPAAEA